MFELELLEKGGYVIYAICAASLIGLTYIIFCMLTLRRRVVFSKSLVDLAENLSSDEGCAAAEETCKKEGGPFAEILLTVIATRKAGREESEALVEGAGRRAAHELSRGTMVLEVVAAISPLMGLLGTVVGMYRVFEKIAGIGVNEVGQLSGGISEALVTTICGLIVAIPAYVAFTYFSRRIDDLVLDMERYAVALMLKLRN